MWGVSPQGAKSKRAFREKFGLPFTLLDEDHQVAEAYGSWVLKENYGRSYWGTARTTFLVDPDGRIARNVAGQGGVMPPTCSQPSTSSRPLARTDALARANWRLRSWGDERSLGRKSTLRRLAAGNPEHR